MLPRKDLEKVASSADARQALSQLMGVLKAPIQKLVRTLAAPQPKLVRTIAAVRDQKAGRRSLSHSYSENYFGVIKWLLLKTKFSMRFPT